MITGVSSRSSAAELVVTLLGPISLQVRRTETLALD